MESREPDKYRHDLEVVRDTASQVIRDFEMAGIEIRFSGDSSSAYTELKQQMLPELQKLYAKNSGSFMALLYRIDVEEKKVNMIISGNRSDFFEQLTEMILEREFLKVLSRKLYKIYVKK